MFKPRFLIASSLFLFLKIFLQFVDALARSKKSSLVVLILLLQFFNQRLLILILLSYFEIFPNTSAGVFATLSLKRSVLNLQFVFRKSKPFTIINRLSVVGKYVTDGINQLLFGIFRVFIAIFKFILTTCFGICRMKCFRTLEFNKTSLSLDHSLFPRYLPRCFLATSSFELK